MRNRLVAIAALFPLALPLLAQPAVQPTPRPQPKQPAPPRPAPGAEEMEAGNKAFEAQRWAEAVGHYQAALAKGMDHALLHFRLGYALHVTGKVEEALGHHLKAAHITHQALRIDALYNAGCACALLGRKDEALKYLQMAIDVGFADANQVRIDGDLDSLRQDEGFKTLIEGIGKTPRLSQQLDRMLGTWERVDPEGKPGWRLAFSRPMAGSHGVLVTEVTPDGAEWSGMAVPNFGERTWTWTMVDGRGTKLEFVGAAQDDGSVQFVGRQVSPTGPGTRVRMTLMSKPDGTLHLKAETSKDGKVWEAHHEQGFRKAAAAGG